MKIDQKIKTVKFDGRLLRTIVSRAHNEAAKHEGRHPSWQRYRVIIKAARQRAGTSGFGWYHSPRIQLNIPVSGDSTRRVALVAYHEIMHTYGYRHSQHVDPSEAEIDRICEGLPERVEPVAPKKPARDLPAERYARLLKREAAWKRKAKRAATELRKIREKRRYYERTLTPDRLAA